MAKKPNYRFERSERERLKAAKTARKAEEKAAQRERDAGGKPPADSEPSSES